MEPTMNKKNYLLPVYSVLFVFFNSSCLLNAQEFDNHLLDVVPPSPMAYEMTRFQAAQPDLYTGIVTTNIPLYTIDFDGWQLPLSLSYHSSGITSNQEASEVGLGWAMNATAVITRQVKSGDDFLNLNDSKGFLFNDVDYEQLLLVDWASLTPTERTGRLINLGTNRTDTEPDTYNYNFFGFSGSFTLRRADPNNINSAIQILKHTIDGVVIDFHSNNPLDGFKIKTPNGYEGTFSIKEISTNLSGTADRGFSLNFNGNEIDKQELIKRGNFRAITAWYLKQIVSPNGKTIDFTYNVQETTASDFVSISTPAIGEERLPSFLQLNSTSGVFYPGNGIRVPFSRQIHEHVYQTGITIPGELNITFTMSDRDDLQKIDNQIFDLAGFPQILTIQKPKKYTGIIVNGLQNESSFSKQIVLGQSYFNHEKLYETNLNSRYNQYQYLRGRLDFVKIDDQSYNFRYANASFGLPVKSTRGIDHFGYYNGNDSNNFLFPPIHGYNLLADAFFLSQFGSVPSENSITWGDIIDCTKLSQLTDSKFYLQRQDRKPIKQFAMAGMLTRVQYPTRGFTEFEYDLHEYHVGGVGSSNNDFLVPEAVNRTGIAGDVKGGGLRISTIKTKDENGVLLSEKKYEYKTILNQSSGLLMSPMLYFQDTSSPNSIFRFQVLTNNGVPDLCYGVFHYQLSIPGSHNASGKQIGYSRVIESTNNVKNNNSYKIFHEFENTPAQFSISPFNNTAVPKVNLRSQFNGKPIYTIAEDENGVPKNLTEYQKSQVVDGAFSALGYTNLDYVFSPPVQLSQGAVPISSLKFIPLTPYEKPIETINISQKKTTEYFDSPNFTTTSDYGYNQIAQLESVENTASNSKTTRKITKRILDYSDETCVNASEGNQCLRNTIIEKNQVSLVLEDIQYKDNVVISAKGYKYDVEHGNIVLREIYEHNRALGTYTGSSTGFDFNGSYDLRVTYDDYDTEGNLLQQTVKDGTSISYIWGYNKMYPIVKGENISYAQLLSVYNSTNSNEDIRENALVENAFITTYEYNPLTGITKMTDPSGRSTSFNYDTEERLSDIRDINQHLVQDYDYKFKELDKQDGLAANAKSFGVVSPGTDKTDYVKITNVGNYDINISDINLPPNFTSVWDNTPIYIPSGASFNLPVVFSAPATLGSYQVNLIVLSNDINGNLTIPLSAISDLETRILRIDPECYNISSSFGSTYAKLYNDGNSPLYIKNISSTDACVTNAWENINMDSEGQVIPYVILPGSSKDVLINLTCAVGGGQENWSESSELQVVYYQNDFSLSAMNFDLKKDNCTTNNGPAYTTTGTVGSSGWLTATCGEGMDGTLTVNYGSVILQNFVNIEFGNIVAGPDIIVSGITMGQGSLRTFTPPSYPFTYNISCNSVDCSSGLVSTELRISIP